MGSSVVTALVCMLLNCDGFFKPKVYENISTHIPTTNEELQDLLCTKIGLTMKLGGSGTCDSEPRRIIIDRVFTFTLKAIKIEPACPYNAFGSNRANSLWRLVSDGGCTDETLQEDIKFSKAGLFGLEVGSNKIIEGNSGGGLKGKGLRLDGVTNVEIRNLAITDINPHLYNGGSGIELIGVRNVLIDGNYFKNIGYSMITSNGAKNTGITISTNLFDGQTTNSFHCDGTHSYVWMFFGDNDQIRLEYNTVLNTGGRSPMVNSKAKTAVHLFKNTFIDTTHFGVIRILDKDSSVLAEGNVFNNVATIVDEGTKGNVFMPETESDEVACKAYLSRGCEVNTVIATEASQTSNSVQVLSDFKVLYDADKSWATWLLNN